MLKSVSKILFDLRENHQIRFYCLNDKFKEIVISNTQNQIEFLIEQDSCEKAKKVVDYYLRIKKILAGYDPVKNKTFVENSSEGINRLSAVCIFFDVWIGNQFAFERMKYV